MTPILATRNYLQLGGAYWRLWNKEQGLLQEISPVVAINKANQQIELYGEEAAQLEGKLPDTLELRRAWWADEIIDRDLLRSLLSYLLSKSSANFRQRWARSLHTEFLLEETVSDLHRRWLRKTAREAGWLAVGTQPAYQIMLQRLTSNAVRTQAVLDVGFSTARLAVYLGDQLLLATADEAYGLRSLANQFADFLQQKHHLEVPASAFYSRRWEQARYVYDLQAQKTVNFSPSQQDWEQVNQEYILALSQWIGQHLLSLSASQQSELQESGIIAIGGGVVEIQMHLNQNKDFPWPVPLKVGSDATYSVLRSAARK